MRFFRKTQRLKEADSRAAPGEPASATFAERLVALGEIGPALVNLTYTMPDAIRAEFSRLSANVSDLIGDEATPYAAAFLEVCLPAGGQDDAVKAVNGHLSQVVSHGYKLGLVRLHLENEVLGRMPRHQWRLIDKERARPSVSALAARAWSDAMRISPWVAVGAVSPLDDPAAMWAAIQYLGNEDFKAVAQYYDPSDFMPRLALTGMTAIGYAIARVQQEPDIMAAVVAALEHADEVLKTAT